MPLALIPILELLGTVAAGFFFSGCASSGKTGPGAQPPPANSPPPEPKLGFSEKNNELAYRLYQGLIRTRQGFPLRELDQGYQVTNYGYLLPEGGKNCTDPKVPFCVQGKGDSRISSEEVWDYALDHSEDTKIREATEGVLARPLPWLLDDFNPNTLEDDKIRERVQDAIRLLAGLLQKQNLKSDTPEYQVKLAVGLLLLVAVPRSEKMDPYKEILERYYTKQLEQLGLGAFKEDLLLRGGLRVDTEDLKKEDVEYSALEAIYHDKGACTELSKILYAVLKMAGFKPFFVSVNPWKTDIEEIKSILNEVPGYGHLCIAIRINGEVGLLDPAIFPLNPSHGEYYLLSLRQYLGLDYHNLGQSLQSQKKMDQARQEYETGLMIDPASPVLYLARGSLWSVKNETDKAIEDYTLALRIHPNDAVAHFYLGKAWAQKKEWKRAIQEFSEAIRIQPNMAAAYCRRGLTWTEQGEFEKAISDYTEALRYNSSGVQIYNARGFAWKKMGKWGEAIADFSKVLELDPKYADAYGNRGLCWFNKQEWDSAIADFSKYLEFNPKDDRTYFFRGDVWHHKLELEKAIADFTEAIRLDSSHPEFLGNRGLTWLEKGNEDKAREDFASALKLSPQGAPELQETLANFFKGQWAKKAKGKVLMKALETETELDVVAAEAKSFLCGVGWELGQEKEAVAQFISIIDAIKKGAHLSSPSKKYLQGLFQHLPEAMRKSPEIQAQWKALALHP
jgi:tetratricopeptide (TPR) repeat protein